MKSLQTIQKLYRLGKTLSKIAFIFSVIGFFGCIAGLISMQFGNGMSFKLGGVTLHGMISGELGGDLKGSSAALGGWLIVCMGEAVLARFAEGYFKNEQAAGTPFTLVGSKELLRLGILTLVIPTGCAVLGSIAEGLIAGFMQVETAAALDLYFDNDASIVLGIMFLLASLLCRYGAELQTEKND